jgi:hypothetical protein
MGGGDVLNFGDPNSATDVSRSPADVIGDPFYDPAFGSQMMGQGTVPGTTPFVTDQSGSQQTSAPTQMQVTPDQSIGGTEPRQQQQNKPMAELAKGLQNVSKLLGGNQQKGPGWIQPEHQQQMVPPAPPQNVAPQVAEPQAPGTPQNPLPQAQEPVPLPRRRPEQANQDPVEAAAATPGAANTGLPPVQAAAAPPTPDPPAAAANQVTPSLAPAPIAPTAVPSIQVLQWLYNLLSGSQMGQASANAAANYPPPAGPPPAGVAGAVPSLPPAPRSAPANPFAIDPNQAMRDYLEGRTAAPAAPQAPAQGDPAGFSPQSYVASVFQIESGNNPNNQTGSNRGLGQFGPTEERMYGLNARNRNDPAAQRQALHREYEHHRGILHNALGREPEPWESYLTHQQGRGGGPALLTANPNAPAWQVLRRFYDPATAVRAIRDNIPGDSPLRGIPAEQVTVGQFKQMWRDRFNRNYDRARARNPQNAPQPIPGDQSSVETPNVKKKSLARTA